MRLPWFGTSNISLCASNPALTVYGFPLTAHRKRFSVAGSPFSSPRYVLHAPRYALHASRYALHASRYALYAPRYALSAPRPTQCALRPALSASRLTRAQTPISISLIYMLIKLTLLVTIFRPVPSITEYM